MDRYRPLPTLDPPDATETLHSYGCRALTFVLETGITCTLTDQELELADHVYPMLIANPEILPVAVDRLSAARHAILAALRIRRADTDQGVTVPTVAPSSAPEGPMARLRPAPLSQPPAGQKVHIAF